VRALLPEARANVWAAFLTPVPMWRRKFTLLPVPCHTLSFLPSLTASFLLPPKPSPTSASCSLSSACRRGSLLGNPHSEAGWAPEDKGSAAAAARLLTLRMCNADPERYTCIFTSGATGSERAGAGVARAGLGSILYLWNCWLSVCALPFQFLARWMNQLMSVLICYSVTLKRNSTLRHTCDCHVALRLLPSVQLL
jgi:hypothetical protein